MSHFLEDLTCLQLAIPRISFVDVWKSCYHYDLSASRYRQYLVVTFVVVFFCVAIDRHDGQRT